MLPKEHGGTVMLAASLVAGAGVGGHLTLALAGVVVAVLGAHLLREPAVRLLRYGRNLPRRTRLRDLRAVVGAGGAMACGGAVLLASVPLSELAVVAAPGAVLGAGVVAAGTRRQARALPVELAGVLVACLAAPAAILAATGGLGPRAAGTFVACGLFFGGATLHLRAIVRRRRAARRGQGRPAHPWVWSVGSVAGAWALAPLGPAFVAGAAAVSVAALRPVILQGRVLVRPQRVGIAETVLAVLFVAVLTVASRV